MLSLWKVRTKNENQNVLFEPVYQLHVRQNLFFLPGCIMKKNTQGPKKMANIQQKWRMILATCPSSYVYSLVIF